MKITGWKLVITWEDDSTEDIVDVPKSVATEVDLLLDQIEEEVDN